MNTLAYFFITYKIITVPLSCFQVENMKIMKYWILKNCKNKFMVYNKK